MRRATLIIGLLLSFGLLIQSLIASAGGSLTSDKKLQDAAAWGLVAALLFVIASASRHREAEVLDVDLCGPGANLFHRRREHGFQRSDLLGRRRHGACADVMARQHREAEEGRRGSE